MAFVDFKASVVATILQLNTSMRKRGRPYVEMTITPKRKKAWTKVLPEIRTDGIDHFSNKMECKNPPRCHEQTAKNAQNMLVRSAMKLHV